jgi:hypothetical protein
MKKFDIADFFSTSTRTLGIKKFTVDEIASKMTNIEEISNSSLPEKFATTVREICSDSEDENNP